MQHGQGKFFERFQNNRHILKRKVMKLSKISEEFGYWISSFVLLKSPYSANKF